MTIIIKVSSGSLGTSDSGEKPSLEASGGTRTHNL